MKYCYLHTTDIAYAVAVHPNTVRKYEAWGLLPPIPRSPSGYRLFSEAHLDQMRLARTAMAFTWLGGDIRHESYKMIEHAASGDLGGALERAYQVLVLVQSERAQAEVAASLLERWASGTVTDATLKPMRIGEVARTMNVTCDMLRNWEHNGLIRIPRNPANGYRLYGANEIGRLRVIRVLRRSGYSMMAILRMLVQLDGGQREGLRHVLDTPKPDEDIGYATDKWLSTLTDMEPRVQDSIAQLEMMLRKSASANPMSRRKDARYAGRTIVVGQFSDILEATLDSIVPYIQVEDVRLCGTAAGLLQGAFQPVRDINLLGKTRSQVDDFAQAMRSYPQVEKPGFIQNKKIYRATHLIRGVEISMTVLETPSGGDGGNGEGRENLSAWNHYTSLPIGRYNILCEALELRLALELDREHPRQYQPLIQHMQRHGADVELAKRAMEAKDITNDRIEKILAMIVKTPLV